jgi:hypothetical protein
MRKEFFVSQDVEREDSPARIRRQSGATAMDGQADLHSRLPEGDRCT